MGLTAYMEYRPNAALEPVQRVRVIRHMSLTADPVSGRALRAARAGFNRALPELVTVVRPDGRRTLGPYPGKLAAGIGDEAVYASRLGARRGYTVQLAAQVRWEPAQAYGVGIVVYPRAAYPGVAFRATVAGTSGGTEPAWPTLEGQTVADGGVSWQAVNVNAVCDVQEADRLRVRDHLLEILALETGQTWQYRIVAICAEGL